MRVYLYMCEFCGTAKFARQDQGDIWFSSCASCSIREGCTFHNKVINIHGKFYCEALDELSQKEK